MSKVVLISPHQVTSASGLRVLSAFIRDEEL